MFTKAIVRTPCRSMVNGITTAGIGKPNYDLAIEQHKAYISALESCDLEVTVLPPAEDFPDSTFIEDVVLVTPHCAVITRPGAYSRRGETMGMFGIMSDFTDQVEGIKAPATLDAGDIMMVDDHFYIGLSERTNQTGANQMKSILEDHDMSASFVRLKEVLHLKTGVAYLENNNLLAAGEFVNSADFAKFNILEVDPDEAYAANSIWVNDMVLMPSGYPKTKQLIVSAGYEVIEVDASEFQKLDGGLSCLSLRF